jgi:dolichol-phosphate mannosyltransferase
LTSQPNQVQIKPLGDRRQRISTTFETQPFLGLLYALSIIVAWVLGATPFDGWAPLMMVILIVGGIIMVMLGVIGEYVWRINEEVRKRPNYIIRQRLHDKNTDA